MKHRVSVIGGGLAGCEAALWLAGQGVAVTLYEQKPQHCSPAHHMAGLAELVCSNSLKAMRVEAAGGLLKAEMDELGSALLPVARACAVPAGGALAVDREAFANGVTRLVEDDENIALVREAVHSAEALSRNGPVLIATGPLTEGPLAEEIARLCGKEQLFFFDAAAPVVTAESLDMGRVFAAARYGRGDDDYLNCPFGKAEYEAFYDALVHAESAALHGFDGKRTGYEKCMPVEVMAKRGADTIRYGPLRPVGLTDPRTGHRPWANVQLRREDAEGRLYNLVGFQTNLKFGEQKRVFSMIPGLANAEFARYGVMHRNTFIDSPAALDGNFALKGHPDIFFAGQITGVEGYMESAATGLLAARAMFAALHGAPFAPPPPETMCGGLCGHLANANGNFQPMGASMELLPPLSRHIKNKQERKAAQSARALAAMREYTASA